MIVRPFAMVVRPLEMIVGPFEIVVEPFTVVVAQPEMVVGPFKKVDTLFMMVVKQFTMLVGPFDVDVKIISISNSIHKFKERLQRGQKNFRTSHISMQSSWKLCLHINTLSSSVSS
jgi:hypothetical protein